LLDPVGEECQKSQLNGGEIVKAVDDEQRPVAAGRGRALCQRFDCQPMQSGPIGPILGLQLRLIGSVDSSQFAQARFITQLGDALGKRIGANTGGFEFGD